MASTHFPLFRLPCVNSVLRVSCVRPGRSQALAGGDAGQRWRRRSAGVCRIRCFGFMHVVWCFGFLPVVWSCASGSWGQISSVLGRWPAVLLLWRLEWTAASTTPSISMNKVLCGNLLICCCACLLLLLLTGSGSEGDEKGSLAMARSRGVRGLSSVLVLRRGPGWSSMETAELLPWWKHPHGAPVTRAPNKSKRDHWSSAGRHGCSILLAGRGGEEEDGGDWTRPEVYRWIWRLLGLVPPAADSK